MNAEYKKPLPRFHNKYAREFYEGCKKHELLIQRCSCGKFRFPPQDMCPECNSMEFEWTKVSGEGRIVTFTVIPHFEPRSMPMASWPGDGYPIMVIVVELPDADGVHIVSNIIDCEPEDIKVGMPVKVVFDDVTEEITLPKFKRA
jgi:hypothetical protein